MLVLAACTGAGSEGASPASDPRPPRAAEAARMSGAMSPVADSLPSDTTAVRFDAAGHPVMPIVLRDYCEGEDCVTHFDAIACLPTGLREAPSAGARISIPLAPGDSAKVVRRDLRVLSPGVVIVRNDFVLDQDEGDEGP